MTVQDVAKSLYIHKIPFATETYRYLLDQVNTKFVNEVVMDICTVCNSRCVYCLHQRNKLIKPQIMQYDAFFKIAYILYHENVKKVHLFQSGEPFLHPQIYDMIELVTFLGMKATIGTRLNCKIDIDELERVVAKSNNTVEFLITVDTVFKGLDWDNINKLTVLQKYKNVKFQFSTVISKINENTYKDVRDILYSLGYKNWYATNMAYYMWNLASQADLDMMSKYLTVNPKFRSRFDIKDGKVVDKPIHCNNLLPTISVNGDVSICCHDMLHSINAGNVLKAGSLRAIVQGKEYARYKKLAKELKLDMCKACN